LALLLPLPLGRLLLYQLLLLLLRQGRRESNGSGLSKATQTQASGYGRAGLGGYALAPPPLG
jgi:hypothetical protein